MQQNWIGRSEGPADPLAARRATAPAGEAELEVYTTRPDTIFGASFMAIAADHPLARKAAAKRSDARRLHRGGPPAPAPRWRRWRRPRRRASTPASGSSIRSMPDWTLPVYVANFVLMDYGTGAIFGCPAGDQRDLDFASKYGLPVIPVVMPDGADAATFQIIDEAYVDDGVMINSRFLDGMTPEQAYDEVADAARSRRRSAIGRRPSARCSTACATGASRASATGAARSRSSIARPAARAGAGRGPAGVLPDDVELRPARQSARPSPDLEARRPARNAAGRRGARPTRWTPSSIRPGISPASPTRGTRRRRPTLRRSTDDGWLPVDQYIGGVEHAILHLLYSRFFARAMRRPAISTRRRAVRRAVHPGHGGARDLPRAATALGAAGRGAGSRRATATRRAIAVADRRAGRDRPDREDVEVEAERRRSRRHHRQLWRRHRALVHAVRLAARARRDLDRGGRRGRPPLRAARLAAGLGNGAATLAGVAPGRPATARPAPFRSARTGRSRRSARISSGLPSTRPWRGSTSWSMRCQRRSPTVAEGTAEPALAGALPRSDRHAGRDDGADDAASGRRMLGGARRHRASSPTGPGRASIRRSTVDNDDHLPVQVNGKKRGELTIARDADQAAVEKAVLGARLRAEGARGQGAAQGDRRPAEDRQCRCLSGPGEPMRAAGHPPSCCCLRWFSPRLHGQAALFQLASLGAAGVGQSAIWRRSPSSP